ncbi:MAG: YqeG family HAD IIIA-type phosphatase [Armatimonadota bacterium]
MPFANSTKPKKRGWMRWCPDQMAIRVTDISADSLIENGFYAVLLDIDNTIIPWQGMVISEAVHAWVDTLRKAGIKICLVSNTHRPKRLSALAQSLGVVHVPHAAKPRRRGLRQALEVLGVDIDHAVMIGDQVFTDIWAGNRMRMNTILVQPVDAREFFGTKISRVLERVLMWGYRRRGKLPAQRNPSDDMNSQIK